MISKDLNLLVLQVFTESGANASGAITNLNLIDFPGTQPLLWACQVRFLV